MGNLYDNIAMLCSEHKITVYKLCTDLGMRNSVISDLKTGRKNGLHAYTLSKIADYFNVSVDYLIGKSNQKENAPATSRSVSDDDIMFALFNGSDGITDEMYEEVKRFAQFIKERESGKR